MKKFIALFISLMLVATTSVFAITDKDIVDTAVDNDLATLVAAVQAAGLEATLRGEGPFTVFAPTEAAFAQLLIVLEVTAAELLAHPRLKEVLLYHVVPGLVLEDALVGLINDADGAFKSTTALQRGEELEFTIVGDGVVINDDGNIIDTDILASNGVIHIIDSVLIPDAFSIEFDTVVDIALSSDDSSILVQALQTAGLVSALQGEGPFTVFAPTNDAFLALLDALDLTAEELLGQSQLAKVLLYHVLAGKFLSTDITDGLTAPTLNDGLLLTFGLAVQNGVAGLGVFINEDTEVIDADIEALNGVVHVIDSVLIPSNFTLDDPIPQTSDDNTLLWVGLLAVLGAGLVVVSRSLNKKVTA